MNPYYEHGGITIYHGDCREILPQLSHVDAVLTDPPYAIPTVVAQGRIVTRNVGDLSIVEAGLGLFVEAIYERLRPDGRVFIFCDGTSYPVLFRLLYGRGQMALLVWNKGQIGMGREFRKSHELIVHQWYPDTPTFSDGVGRADVLEASPVHVSDRLHPAQKPIPLLRQLLHVCGDTICDPFAGSGSTLVAARESGRRAIGIEIEERFCEIAARRLDQEVLPLLDAPPDPEQAKLSYVTKSEL